MGKYITNEYVNKGEYFELHIIGSIHGNKITLIDTDDIERVKLKHWIINKAKKADKIYYYIISSDEKLLNRYIMNAEGGRKMPVDHIDHDTLNNRKYNLRICTLKENLRKSELKSTSTSGVTGVTWYKTNSKWMAHIMVDYKHKTLGYFNTIEEAKETRIKAEQKYFGDFAPDREINDKMGEELKC